jgi:DNA polymerase III sliding clamp (beta) subunit (PCNA family)
MKTTVKGIKIKKAIELAKPFVGNLRMKTAIRSVLKTALITPEYVIATDSHRLIRIHHNEEVKDNYLHHYKEELTKDVAVISYPQVDRLFPETRDAQVKTTINVAEWLEAHTLGMEAAKEHKNKVIHLKENEFTVNFPNTEPNFEDIAFRYSLDSDTGIEEVHYNCEYMLQALKMFKKMKIQTVTLYFYGKVRPMLLVSENVEMILMPVRL